VGLIKTFVLYIHGKDISKVILHQNINHWSFNNLFSVFSKKTTPLQMELDGVDL
jgi:hypothetical protein